MKKVLLIFLLLPLFTSAQIITTIAGNGTPGYSGDSGPATAAEIYNPSGVSVDGVGNVYIADVNNNRIRKVNLAGIISTIAGTGPTGYSGDGAAATLAKLNDPINVAVDPAGNIYIADRGNNLIRKVDPVGIISTFAGNTVGTYSGDGGPATNAELYNPCGIAFDLSGNVYIADNGNHCIRKVDTRGIITTIAGKGGSSGFSGDGGPATAAQLNSPIGLAMDKTGNLYFSDEFNFRIRKIDTSGVINTIAGTGVNGYGGDEGAAATATISYTIFIALDKTGNLYLADNGSNHRVRKIDTSGIMHTAAGTGISGYTGDWGAATAAELTYPDGVAVNKAGDVYICDGAGVVRKINAPPRAAFITTTDSVCQDSCITFINTSTGDIDSVIWAIASDTISKPHSDTVTVCFPLTGLSTMKLYVYDSGKIMDSAVQVVSTKQMPHPRVTDTLQCGLFVPNIYQSYKWYSWIGGLTPYLLGDTTNYSPSTGGLFAYVIVDSNGCFGISDSVMRCPGGVPNISKSNDETSVFPNPASIELTIEKDLPITSVAISNLVGKLMFKNDYNSKNVQINVGSLPAGIYFIKINGTEVRRFVKE